MLELVSYAATKPVASTSLDFDSSKRHCATFGENANRVSSGAEFDALPKVVRLEVAGRKDVLW